MKTCNASLALLGLSLVVLPFVGGCSQGPGGDANPFLGTANAEPVSNGPEPALVASNASNSPVVQPDGATPSADTNAPTLAEAPKPGAAPVAGPQLPPNLNLSGPLAEVVKLTQAGVDEAVLLTFITNTTGVFNLGADEIVYLNDLGVPGDTITLMMQHDQSLRELRMNALQASTATPAVAESPATAPAATSTATPANDEPVASAPSYVSAPAMEAQPAYVSNEYFYNTLSPYGSWVYVAGYGNCWRPTVVVNTPGWRPYCNRGRWVYSNCGWYWLSDYSWGATTFHYGRWFNAPNYGWCWYPDTVWAPSWVSWRYTSAYCGWAPLPPTACYQTGVGLTFQNSSVGVSFGFGLSFGAYAFVPWGNFCSPHPYQYCLPPANCAQVYNTSVAVNHLEAGGRGQVYNRGIAPERVREYSRSEVRTVRIHDQSRPGARAESLDGNTLVVNRPVLVPESTRKAYNRVEPAARNFSRTEARGATELMDNPSPNYSYRTAPSRSSRPEFNNARERTATVRTREPIALPASPRSTTTPTSPVIVKEPTTKPLPRQPATRSSSVVVIGDRDNARPAGRDYSVWSTRPARATQPSAPQYHVNPRPAPTRNYSVPQLADNAPAREVRAPEVRNVPSRTEYRSARPTYSAPVTRAPAPQYALPSRPAPATAPQYTPQSRPVPTAPAYQSAPAPARPAR